MTNNTSKTFNIWNSITLFSAIIALFFLLTNGIPLVQLGWIPAFPGKNVYQNMSRIALSSFFLIFLFLYIRQRNILNQLSIVRFVRAILKRPLPALLLLLTLIYIAILSLVSTLRHLSGEGGDIAIFTQAIWNGTQGDFLYSSIKNGICVLGDHMSPILAAVIPLYKLWPDPILVLILQAITIGSGIYLTGWIARDHLKSDFLAIVFGIIYFFYFPARATLHYEFHPEALVEPFIFLAFIFAERKHLIGFLISLFVVILGKENMPGITFILGFYVFAFKSWKRVGLTVMILSIIIFLVEVKWLMPHLLGDSYQYSYYGHSKINPSEAFEYFFKTYLPVLFLPFFNISTLILTFPILFQNMLSANELLRSSSRHYTIGLHPLLFISAIYGFRVICDKWPAIAKHKNIAICLVLWLSLLRSGPSEYFYAWNFIKAERPYDSEMLAKILAIDSKYSVLTQANFLPRVANRKDLYVLDYRTLPNHETIDKHQFDYILFSRSKWPLESMPLDETLTKLKDLGYAIDFEKEGFYILKRADIPSNSPVQ